MSSISGVSGLSNAWTTISTQRSQAQARLFSRVDADSSGAVDETELSTMVAEISKKTGTTLDTQKLFKTMDCNSDGSLSSDELASGLQSAMPAPPSTVDFASQRSGRSGEDDLFSKVDSNSDGSVDEAEMTTFTNKMTSETGLDAPASFATLDTNSDGKLNQSEFDAGKPSAANSTQAASATAAPQGAGGPPPAGGPGGPGAATSSSSTTYDPLDTNQDGTVSEIERLAGALKELVSASESGDTSTKASDSILELAKRVYQQISSGILSGSSGNTLSTTA